MKSSIITNRMLICPQCNSEIAKDDSLFCNDCGYRLITQREGEKESVSTAGNVNEHNPDIFYEECGNQILDDSLFCNSCGTGTSINRNPVKTVISDYQDILGSIIKVNIEYKTNPSFPKNMDLAVYRIKKLPSGELIAVDEKTLEETEPYKNDQMRFPVENFILATTVKTVKSGEKPFQTSETLNKPCSDNLRVYHGKILELLLDYKNRMKNVFIDRKKKEFIHQNGKRNQYYYYTGKKAVMGGIR